MIVCSVTVGAPVFPSVFVAKSPCKGCDEAGVAGSRAGAEVAAGAVGAVVAGADAGAELSAMAASENLLTKVPVKRENKS